MQHGAITVESKRDRVTELENQIKDLMNIIQQSQGVAAYAKLVEENKELRQIIATITPGKTIEGVGTVIQGDALHVNTKMCLATATIFVTEDGTDWNVITLQQTVYPGNMTEFVQEVPRALMMSLSRIPAPVDLPQNWRSFGIPDNEFGSMLHELGACRRESHEKYLDRRKRFWHHYRETIEQHVVNDPRKRFEELLDRAFASFEDRHRRQSYDFKRWDK